MKKVLSFILVSILMFTMLPYVSAASVPTMTMSSSGGHDVGDIVTLTISFDYGENKIKSIAMDSFTYDQSVLKLNSLSWEIGGFLSAADPDGDSLLAFTSATKVSGVVMKAEVEIIGQSSDLTQEITFNSLITPESGSNISVAVTGGVITLNPAKITGLQTIAVTAPVKGAVPQATIAAGSGYTGTISWEGNPTKFTADTVYVANITLTAADGYVFAAGATGSVSGATVTNNSVSNDGKTLTFKATFPKTASKDTPTCVAPTNVTAIYGQKLSDITLNNPTGNTAGTWTWTAPTTSVGNVGTRTFKATFTPNDTSNYLTVENVDVSVKVNPKPITVTVDNIADQQYTGSQIKPTVTVKGDGKTLVLNTDYTVEYGTNKNVGTNGGSVTVIEKSGSNYTFSNTTKNFNIVAKAGQVTISGNLNVTYPNTVPNVTIDKYGSDGTVIVYYYTNAACTTGKTTTKPTNAGNYWAKAEMAAGTNYGSAVSNVLAFAISRANITPSVSIANWTYLGTVSTPAVSGNTGNGAVTYQYKVKGAADSTYTATVPTNAGDYTIKATVAQTTNYNGASATADFKINPKDISDVTIDAIADQRYTGNAITPKPSVKDGTSLLVFDTDFTYSYESNTNAGTATVKVVGKGNYIGTVSKTFAIIRKDLSITVSITGWTVGGTPNAPAVTGNLGNGAVTYQYKVKGAADSTYTATVPTAVGNYTVKATVAQTANYNGASATTDFAISTKAAQTVTAENVVVTYGDSGKKVSGTTNGNGTISYAVKSGSDVVEVNSTTGALTIKKAGPATITVTASETASHAAATKDITVTVNAKKITAPAADNTVYIYNGNEQTYKITANDAYTITGNKQTAANVTGYTVTVALKDTANYQWNDGSVEAKNYTFIIKKATITITAKNKSAYVNDAVPALSDSDYTVSGLVNNETLKTNPTIAYEITPDMSKEGSVNILVSGAVAPDGGNYNDIVYNNGKLSITNKSSGGIIIILKYHNVTVNDTEGGSVVADKIRVTEDETVTLTLTADEGYTFESVKVVDESGEEITVSDSDDKYTFNMPASDVTVTATFKKIETPVVPITPATPATCKKDNTCPMYGYTDLVRDNWYHDAVHFCIEQEIILGTSATTFEPDAITSRAMVVTILWRLEGKPIVNSNMEFTDVANGLWYSEAIDWASANGIINGYDNGKFGPNDTITREQMATIMWRYAKYKGYDVSAGENTNILSYTDAEIVSDWAIPAMQWACGAGLINGTGKDILDPIGDATRAQVAAMLMRFIEKTK